MWRVVEGYLEAHEGDLHGEDGSQAVDGAVGHVDAVGEASGEHEDQHVQRDEVDKEHVASPGRHLHKRDTGLNRDQITTQKSRG